MHQCSVADPHYVDADPDPDPTFHFEADPDPDPSFQIKAQNLEKLLKQAHFPYSLACHLQIDADPGTDPACHFDADPDPTFQFDPDPDPQHCSLVGSRYFVGKLKVSLNVGYG